MIGGYSSWLNGKAERYVRTLENVDRKLRCDADMSRKLRYFHHKRQHICIEHLCIQLQRNPQTIYSTEYVEKYQNFEFGDVI